MPAYPRREVVTMEHYLDRLVIRVVLNSTKVVLELLGEPSLMDIPTLPIPQPVLLVEEVVLPKPEPVAMEL